MSPVRHFVVLPPALILFASCLLQCRAIGDVPVGATQSGESVDYLRQVKPILMARCSRCHNSVENEGELRLDDAVEMKKGGVSGPVLIPGKASDSRLIEAVLQTSDLKMPPEGAPLSAEQIDILRRWIDQGAMAPADETVVTHWSFLKPDRPAVPSVQNAAWVLNPIDAFIAKDHERQALQPLPSADKATLLRRVSLDLVGLPPSPEQLQAFLNDDSSDAYEKVVDRLLESQHYGERWGRHWMDVWRYSDWDGYGAEVRESKPHIWRWRDWIIQSLNEDKPYDQMVIEMLAGDEVAPTNPDTLRATGFLVRNWYTFNRNIWLDNIIEHTGKAFMGVTFNCARCHDHMYDPVRQTEYYQLRAFFEPHDIRTDRIPGVADTSKDGLVRVYDSTPAAETFLFVRGDEKNPLKDRPVSPAFPKMFGDLQLNLQPVSLNAESVNPGMKAFVVEETRAAARQELAAATEALVSAQKSGMAAPLEEGRVAAASAALAFVEARIAADEAAFATPPSADAKSLALAAIAAERLQNVRQTKLKVLEAEKKLTDAKTALKSDDAALTKAVRDAEAALAKATEAHLAADKVKDEPSETYTRLTPVYPAVSTGRRLAFAKWIASSENPLTARVAVNHLWMRHFHQPLVPTVFDFGMNGKPATHPELLDWLASELVASGWKMKAIHRLMVTSQTYQMASTAVDTTPEAKSVAEVSVASDPDNRWYWRQNARRMEAELIRDATLFLAGSLDVTMYGADLDPNSGLTSGRRSVYFRNSKEKKMTFLATFDSANPVECYRRAESISPQQSLAMSNSPLTLSQGRILAGRLVAQLPSAGANELAAAPVLPDASNGAGDSALAAGATSAIEQQGGTATPDAVSNAVAEKTPGTGGTAASANSQASELFVDAAFRHILCRKPSAEERQECLLFLEKQSTVFSSGTALTAFTGGSEAAVKPSADPMQRARENLVHVLLNHHDFITIH